MILPGERLWPGTRLWLGGEELELIERLSTSWKLTDQRPKVDRPSNAEARWRVRRVAAKQRQVTSRILESTLCPPTPYVVSRDGTVRDRALSEVVGSVMQSPWGRDDFHAGLWIAQFPWADEGNEALPTRHEAVMTLFDLVDLECKEDFAAGWEHFVKMKRVIEVLKRQGWLE